MTVFAKWHGDWFKSWFGLRSTNFVGQSIDVHDMQNATLRDAHDALLRDCGIPDLKGPARVKICQSGVMKLSGGKRIVLTG